MGCVSIGCSTNRPTAVPADKPTSVPADLRTSVPTRPHRTIGSWSSLAAVEPAARTSVCRHGASPVAGTSAGYERSDPTREMRDGPRHTPQAARVWVAVHQGHPSNRTCRERGGVSEHA